MSTETHAVALVAASSRWRPRTLAHLVSRSAVAETLQVRCRCHIASNTVATWPSGRHSCMSFSRVYEKAF